MRFAAPSLVLLAVACAKGPEAPAPTEPVAPQVATFTATEFAFSGPDSIAPGMTEVRMVNGGKHAHHLILARLDSGKTIDDVMAALQANPNAEPGWVTWVGGAGEVGEGGTSAAVSDLQPGNYVAFCFLPDQTDGGKPHVAKGMVKAFRVAGPVHAAPAPTATLEIHMSDFTYAPVALTAGTHTIKVINDGKQTHEAALIRLPDGATKESFMAAFAPGYKGPPPAGIPQGGNGAISAGGANWWTTTLTPGTYLIVCFVPDQADGVPHAMKGMVQAVTVN